MLIEIDFARALEHWARAAGTAPDALAARFGPDAAYQAHERGEIAEHAYFAALAATLGIDLSDQQWRAGWNAIFVGEVPGARALLAATATQRPVYVFSNTNATHALHWRSAYPGLLDPARAVYLSCEIGRRKPDRAAFEAVVAAIGVAPQRIAFFDDSAHNVAGARDAGLQAHLVESPALLGRLVAAALEHHVP